MSVEFFYFLTLFTVFATVIVWELAEKSFLNGLAARAGRPQAEATQITVPFTIGKVLGIFAAFFSTRWYRIDYFDPERGVIICSNLYSKLDSRYCDVRLTADGPERTVVSVRVSAKIGLYRSRDRENANKALLATLHAALFAAASVKLMKESLKEGEVSSD